MAPREVDEAADLETPTERLRELFEAHREALAWREHDEVISALFANPSLPHDLLQHGAFGYSELLPIVLANPTFPFFLLEWGPTQHAHFRTLVVECLWPNAKDDPLLLPAIARVVAADRPHLPAGAVDRMARLAKKAEHTGPGFGFARSWHAIVEALGGTALVVLELLVRIDAERTAADPAAPPWELGQAARVALGSEKDA